MVSDKQSRPPRGGRDAGDVPFSAWLRHDAGTGADRDPRGLDLDETPGSQCGSRQAQAAANSLRMMPGVLRVEAGRTVPALSPGLDRSFDLGVVTTFCDRAALQRYEKNPRHLGAMRRYLRPLVRRYEVYNFSSR